MVVLIIGLGSIAGKHITALRHLDNDAIIYALRSAIAAANTEGVINIYDIKELQTTVDFVIISNPTNLHRTAILSAIALEVPMMIEKPVLDTLEQADVISDSIKKKGILTYVACNLRFHPCIEFLKDRLTNTRQAVNEVNIYCGSYLPDWRSGKDFKEIYSADRTRGGGVHLDLFHEMDYACWLFGLPGRFRSFQSDASTLGIEAADYANYLLNYTKFNISIILNYYRCKAKRTIEILFENETWLVDLITCKIVNDKDELIFSYSNFHIMESYKKQMAYFINCIQNGIQPMNTFDESVRILKISVNG